MNWSTICIKGRNGFKEVLRNKLDDSWLSGTPDSNQNLLLFWLDVNTSLVDLKRAIGSEIIFRYRLQFITDPDKNDMDKSHTSEPPKSALHLTMREKSIIVEIEAWEKARSEGRPNGRATLDRNVMDLIINSRNDN